jgi:PAS domain S-box-containing protein
MLERTLQQLQGISLKWKLLIPFLFFAFAGTTTLTVIGLTSQQRLIKKEEREKLLLHYRNVRNELERKGREATALATIIAENREVQRLMNLRDREGLNDLLVHTYMRLKVEYDISQFHFHIPPGISFLRLHSPKMYGDDLHSYRRTIVEALKRFRPVWGLEFGETGFGIRGVVPIFYGTQVVGTVEIGNEFGKSFLEDLHRRWNIDLALYSKTDGGSFEPMAFVSDDDKEKVFFGPKGTEVDPLQTTLLIAPKGLRDRAILLSPVRDYSGNVVALVEISQDRSSIRQRLERSRNVMVLVGGLGIIVSFLLTYLVAILYIRPIKKIVREARDIADEKRESYLDPGLGDEIGTLTLSLNRMLASLMERRSQIEEYAKNLEKRVQERTVDLVASEEKYRSLVEQVPLIVYRLLQDGTTEFINSCLTEWLGYAIEEAVGDRYFWKEKILGNDESSYNELFETCFKRGKEYRSERVVQDKKGRPLVFLDHAIPAKDERGRVLWIDGIMMDITELKQLQERALRTEETRLLGEISARMAHEIRNPLASAGGFARRLRDALPEEDPNRRTAEIIVKEVARMETFLRILLTSIRPVELSLSEVNVNRMLRSWLEELKGLAESREIRVEERLDRNLPLVMADEERLNEAFASLLKHAVVSMREGDHLEVRTHASNGHIQVRMMFQGRHISDDDLEHFFFPHLEQDPEKSVLDLPLSKIIVHRHGGSIDVFREEDLLVTNIDLPVRPAAERSE